MSEGAFWLSVIQTCHDLSCTVLMVILIWHLVREGKK